MVLSIIRSIKTAHCGGRAPLSEVEVGAGVKVCEKKVKAILEMKRPSNAQELKSFIGMCSYYVPSKILHT